MTDRAEERPRPLHLAVLVGASAGIYAMSLGTVAALQSATDRAVIDARAPLDRAIRDLAATNAGLTAGLDRVAHADDGLSSAYDRVGPLLGTAETTLDALSASVARISGIAGALPDRVALPAVPRTVVSRATSPAHATSGASGGG